MILIGLMMKENQTYQGRCLEMDLACNSCALSIPYGNHRIVKEVDFLLILSVSARFTQDRTRQTDKFFMLSDMPIDLFLCCFSCN